MIKRDVLKCGLKMPSSTAQPGTHPDSISVVAYTLFICKEMCDLKKISLTHG